MSFRDNSVTRFLGGQTNVSPNDIFNSLREEDPSIYIRLQEEFTAFTAADWSTGGVGTPTRAAQAGFGGLIRLGGSAASGDNSWLQTLNPNYQVQAPTTIRKMFFSTIVTPDDATNIAFVAGFQIPVAANNFLTPVNGIYFRKSAAAATLELVSRAASVETTSGAIPGVVLANATAVKLQIFYDGITDIWGAVNGAVVARITPAALPTVLMAPTLGEQNGTAVTRTLDVDNIFAFQERVSTPLV